MTSTVRAILRCTWDGLMILGKPGILGQGGMTSTVRAIPRCTWDGQVKVGNLGVVRHVLSSLMTDKYYIYVLLMYLVIALGNLM